MIPASYLFKDVYRRHWGEQAPGSPPHKAEQAPTRHATLFARLLAPASSAAAAARLQPRGRRPDPECYGA